MAELYVMHHATCARKALMALLEKGAPVGTRELDRLYLRSPEYRALNPDGVFLSNGPGDPEPLDYAIGTIRDLLGKKPIFGICLGHQLLGLALQHFMGQ